MANPYHHAVSSSRKWGGTPADYQPVHDWFDLTKAHHADFRHRALRHHAEGIFLMESIFGPTLSLSCNCQGKLRRLLGGKHKSCSRGKQIPTRWVGEQHVLEDLGLIPNASDWLKHITPEPWMKRSRKLSVELEDDRKR